MLEVFGQTRYGAQLVPPSEPVHGRGWDHLGPLLGCQPSRALMSSMLTNSTKPYAFNGVGENYFILVIGKNLVNF
jgi:hypothetical protein